MKYNMDMIKLNEKYEYMLKLSDDYLNKLKKLNVKDDEFDYILHIIKFAHTSIISMNKDNSLDNDIYKKYYLALEDLIKKIEAALLQEIDTETEIIMSKFEHVEKGILRSLMMAIKYFGKSSKIVFLGLDVLELTFNAKEEFIKRKEANNLDDKYVKDTIKLLEKLSIDLDESNIGKC